MRLSEIRDAKTWRLRKRITDLNKALDGARRHPNGLTRLTVEDIERELPRLREELRQRATQERSL